MPEHNVVFTATTDGTVTPDECTYTVVYHYVDRDGNEETETDPKDRPSTAGTPVSGLYDTNRTSHSDTRSHKATAAHISITLVGTTATTIGCQVFRTPRKEKMLLRA